ncbi:MAG: hypothetical protein LBQ75_10155 [Zoogloeaceae bacterium]|jgi:hypothetical protein|nr:hypothetical protein [Zoogloeaceae bacterium]
MEALERAAKLDGAAKFWAAIPLTLEALEGAAKAGDLVAKQIYQQMTHSFSSYSVTHDIECGLRGQIRDIVMLERSARSGNKNAQCSMGLLYEDISGKMTADHLVLCTDSVCTEPYDLYGKLFGEDSPTDMVTQRQAERWGILYRNRHDGDRWTWNSAKWFVIARAWLRYAADQGHAEAQCELGELYSGRPFSGLYRDYAEAEKWFRKAAAQGHIGAQAALKSIEKRKKK